MERKVGRLYQTAWHLALAISSCTILSCTRPAQFSSYINEGKIRFVSAAHNVFVAGRSAKEELSFSFTPDVATQEIEMLASAPQNVIMKQIERPVTTDTHIQGHQGNTVDEEFPVLMLDKLDLLVVVDNSSSMGPYQQKLARGLAPLLSNISNTDWHMMVTSTSAVKRRNPADPTLINRFYGCPRINTADAADKAVITRDDMVLDPDAVSAQFSWKVTVGESGDPVERGVLAATSGLAGECGQIDKSWVRADAHKVVLLLSDEENCGSDGDQECKGALDSNPQYFLENAPKGTQFFALLYDHEKYSECLEAGYNRKPDDYRWLIDKTGGKEGNICIDNYSGILTEISRNMHPVPRKEFKLAYVPELGSIRFTVNDKPWATNFQVDGKKILIEDSLPVNARVLRITYTHDPVPLVKRFTLSTVPDLATLQVKVNGKILDITSYTSDGNIVELCDLPPAKAIIELSYRSVTPLPQFFPLPDNIILETLNATVDRVPITDFLVVGTESYEIFFREAPRDSATIVLTFEEPGTRVLSYPSLAYDRNKVDQIAAYDKDTGKTVPLQWDKQELSFRREDVQHKRAIEVVYILAPESNELVLELYQQPREGSLNIQASADDQTCVQEVAKNGSRLAFPCPPQMLGNLRLNYDYISQIDNSFRMRGDYSKDSRWKVKVNGNETSDFIRNGNLVEFPDANFTSDTVIDIEVLEPIRS
jgi:hypothetical protein